MLENSKYKSHLAFFVILIVYLVFVMPYSPLFLGLGYDQEIFQYIGMLIDSGQVPYKDVFDHKPPIIYVLNYLGFLLTPNSTWGIFIILNTIGLLSALLIYRLAIKQTKKVLFSIIIVALYVVLINSDVFLQGGNFTRQFTAYLTVGILYLVFSFKKSKYVSVLLGVIIGFIFFTQQNEILGGLILIVYHLFFEQDFKLFSFRKIVVNSIAFLSGLGFSFLAITLLIYGWHNYSEFIYQAYLYNFDNYIQQKSIFYKIAKIIYVFGLKIVTNVSLSVVVLIIISHLLFSVFKKKKIAIPFQILIVAFTFQVIATSISGRAFGHYFLMFVPFIIVLLIYAIGIFRNKYDNVIYTFLALSIAVHFIQNVSYKKIENNLLSQTIEKVSLVKGVKGQFYSFDASYLRVNFNLNIIAPSQWIYTHYMDEKMLEQILNDLESNKTKFILVQAEYIEELSSLKQFLNHLYNPVLSEETHVLFERK